MSYCPPTAKRPKPDNDSICDNSPSITSKESAVNFDLLRDANKAVQDSNRLHVRPIIEESRLGIEIFVGNKDDEFHGIIKTQYSDFIVHEIDPDGVVTLLTTLEPPEEEYKTKLKKIEELLDAKAIECLGEVNDGYLNQFQIDVTGMSKEERTALHHVIRHSFDRLESTTEIEKAQTSESTDRSTAEVTVPDTNVDSTTNDDAITHKPDSCETGNGNIQLVDTVEKKFILVKRRNKMTRTRNFWPQGRPDHTHFILYKENKDTIDAIHNLAAAINCRPSSFSYAGIKDRRAVTAQWVSSWRLEPKRLISATRRFNKRPYLKVGNFCFKKDPLRLGQLKANKFDIVIRHLVHNSSGRECIEKSMESIKHNGFINYFGLQRFGTRSILTHEIGLAVLQGSWEKAVDLVLSYRNDDNMHPPINSDASNAGQSVDSSSEPSQQAEGTAQEDTEESQTGSGRPNRNKSESRRWAQGVEQHNSFIHMWKSKLDADIVFKKYPHYRFTNEGVLMRYLSKSEECSRDFANAINALPRTTRSLYIHAYQSLLWNMVASYRLKKYGFKVVPGDLLLSDVSDNSLDILLSSDIQLGGDQTPEIVDKRSENNSPASSQGQYNCPSRKAPVELIESKLVLATEENLDRFSIFDVVLPIVGSRTILPENDVKTEILRLLSQDGLDLESFKSRERNFITYGSYRKLLVKPENVNWRFEQYSNPYHDLIETDLDRLNANMESQCQIQNNSIEKNQNNHSNHAEGDQQLEKPHQRHINKYSEPSRPQPNSESSDEALIISFELPPSAYATMCLREIMKKPSTDFNKRF